MDKERLLAGVEKARAVLRAIDDARRKVMLAAWDWMKDSPQKAGWVALVIALLAFILGRWSK